MDGKSTSIAIRFANRHKTEFKIENMTLHNKWK